MQKGLRSSVEGKEMCMLFFRSFFPSCKKRLRCKVRVGGALESSSCFVASEKTTPPEGEGAGDCSDPDPKMEQKKIKNSQRLSMESHLLPCHFLGCLPL